MKLFWNKIKAEPAFAVLCNLGLMLVVYFLLRIAFFLVNISYFSDMTQGHFLTLLGGGVQFDIAAIMYTNLLYILMQILPFKFRLNTLYQTMATWVFVVTNSCGVIANCCDFAYFPFTNRRTTSTVFTEFQNENNIAKIVGYSLLDYWYVVIFVGLLIFGIYKLHCKPSAKKLLCGSGGEDRDTRWKNTHYYGVHSLLMCLLVFGTIIGIRGHINFVAAFHGTDSRPLALYHANKYANKNSEIAIVLNTPFSIIRTVNQKAYRNPHYFQDEAELAAIYSPIHLPTPQGDFKPLNVVVLILESFSKEYSGWFNKHLEDGTYKGYTPFLDSLYTEGLTFKYSYANGRQSIDGMPAILSSIPRFMEPFIVTPYNVNDISGIPKVLKEKGYYSAFFHGGRNASMGFSSYARQAGFDDYFGLDEYGDKDFDGIWGVWDEEFMQFYATKMGTFRQPFMTTVFTLSSHQPFKIPERYEGKFPEGKETIAKAIGYTDYAIRQFFKTMKLYDWFENTLFVITADHTSKVSHDEYYTDINRYSVPILFYHPGSDLKGFVDTMAVQQIDIMPTILSYMNYDMPYFAFGQDILTTQAEDKFVANYNEPRYQFIYDDYFLQFDGQQTNAVYAYKSDTLLQNNLAEHFVKTSQTSRTPPPVSNTTQVQMETMLKAIIQQYMMRMSENQLTINTSNNKNTSQ
ncbi:LTA synthase family protein [Candidatus Symbiothrix dinenymphae]|uniref:LTA synthase family protein n=1 Tax=Candidatus Symbiothrix dinenymphae TaxID=467085 RepID=UPI0006C40443|nr:LTA synthase family protein [Candidatus Symbiothrix dinenymphae]GAP72751.1 sulfatase [Candidatus Symbiothrix dinenymphae]